MSDLTDTADRYGSTEESMNVDTGFLDVYRRRGLVGVDQLREQQAAEAEQQAHLPADHNHSDHGSSSSSSSSSEAPTATTVAPAADSHESDRSPAETTPDPDPATTPPPVPLTHTDHQEAVQSAGAVKAGHRGGEDTVVLPTSGFRLPGVSSQPVVRALPEAVLILLRNQLTATAVRELAVSQEDAENFSNRLSQTSLVTAFLLAQLDTGLDTDPATQRAAELFRSQDPLLGGMARRMEDFEQTGQNHQVALQKMSRQLADLTETAAVLEQAVSYQIADRAVNLLRETGYNVQEIPLGHKDAIFVRDRVREATRKRRVREQQQDGRTIR